MFSTTGSGVLGCNLFIYCFKGIVNYCLPYLYPFKSISHPIAFEIILAILKLISHFDSKIFEKSFS